MNCDTRTANGRNRRHRAMRNDFFPHFGNIVNEVLNTPLNEIVKEDRPRRTIPSANILETDEAFKIELAVPGCTKEEIKIEIENRKMKISADKSIDADTKYKRKEFDFGTFSRTFRMSRSVDPKNITASVVDGILSITLAKAEAMKARTIDIT